MSWWSNLSGNRVIVNGVEITSAGVGLPPDPEKFLNSKDDRVIVLAQPGEYKLPHEFKGNVTIVVLGANSATQVNVQGDVGGDIELSQGSISVTGRVNGSVETSQGSIRVEGDVGGKAETSQGSIEVRGDVGGKVETSMGKITIHGKAKTR